MALDSLADARGELGTDPVAASESLDRARRSLLRLRDYYVPLLEARELSHRAQLWFQAGEPAHTLEDLEATEDLLLRISDQGDPQLSRELDAPLRTVVQARAAVRSDRREAPELIERIENEIQMLLLKGQLVLHQTHLSEWQRSEL